MHRIHGKRTPMLYTIAVILLITRRCQTKLMIATTIATALALTPLLAADNPAEQLDDAAAVFSEIMATPDRGIPQELLEKAHCIVIVPELKTAAFVFGVLKATRVCAVEVSLSLTKTGSTG
jgi:hypothetical protein